MTETVPNPKFENHSSFDQNQNKNLLKFLIYLFIHEYLEIINW